MISRQIANSHTVFNITMTLIWVCLINVMVKIVMTLIPDGKAVAVDPAKPLYLDEKMTNQPTAALQLVAKEILHISDIVKDAVSNTIEIVKTEDISQLEGLLEKGKKYQSIDGKNNRISGTFILFRNNDRAAGSSDSELNVYFK